MALPNWEKRYNEMQNKVSKNGDTMTGDLILDNAHYLKGIDKEGNVIQLIRAYGNKTAIGDGEKEMRFWASTMPTVEINGKVHTLATREQNILWQDEGKFMNGTQVVTLSQKISEQNNGIVLVFAEWDIENSKLAGWGYNTFFIPKTIIDVAWNGVGMSFQMCQNNEFRAYKYLYINDDKIYGNDGNAQTQNNVDNRNKVLVAVIGV